MVVPPIGNNLYVCKKCKEPFLFTSDKEDHVRLTGHTEFMIVSYESRQDKPGFEN
jgi:hypothetical protein